MRLLAINLAVVAGLVVLAEGGSSLFLFVWDAATSTQVAERRHTTYDPELGWVNVPGVHVPGMYGPGIDLTTNARGFRGKEEIEREVPGGKRRVICAGDSFTLGYGVRDEDTWCAKLAAADAGWQPVNMGQGGYGVDQAYLWYRRDAADIAHDVLVFALITDDFRRMKHDSFVGYGKPVLEVDEAGALAVRNVPVPSRAYAAPWVTRNVKYLKQLRSVELLRRGLVKLGVAPAASDGAPAPEREAETRRVAAAVFAELARLTRERGASLVLVYLPTEQDHAGDASREWRALVAAEAERLGVGFVDAVAELKKLSAEDARRLYIPEGALDYPGAAGHFNEAGNEYAARLVGAALQSIAKQ